MPDLRILDVDLAAAVDAEIARRALPADKKVNAAKSNRAKYLLSGIIKCGVRGSSYKILGKGYYRCARNHERGTCGNKTSVRVDVVEAAALSALQSQLLTPDLAKLSLRNSRTKSHEHQQSRRT
jgi:site-specific DNA recombinase